jgi:hypothetical protein
VSIEITISHVYLSRGVVAAWVVVDRTVHRVGHLPWQGWFCCCPRGKRCGQIAKVKELVPVAAVELGARSVEAGIAPGAACHVRPPEQAPLSEGAEDVKRNA